MEWRIIVGAAVLGVLALALAFLSDRRSRKRRHQASLPPDRNIPNLEETAAPSYVSAEEANTPRLALRSRPSRLGSGSSSPLRARPHSSGPVGPIPAS